ncbi:DUF4105 domain-containing protein [Salinisphaera sp. Q1T1-3]|uniref:Lnb N-terminal periplasmic domain-containing protein n=1 Tax=Salinisphaera sp. Q1T1-3 TaxID=2321229 RepID=UPI000E713F4A|nr:DUF4105 domain-containing protein [Salinisphaera sp. Q1T1-3]RJS91585.1 DUF4105 domain-containing protein [Salinisphaera sp. Q1T1-3]
MLGVFGGLLAATPPAVADASATVARLQRAAAAAGLADRDTWRALVHYEPNWMHGGVHSEVGSDWFFLAGPDGRHDPAAELDATIAGLFSDRPVGPRKLATYCLFVARRKWLVRQLDIDVSQLPVHDCPKYRRWKAMLSPRQASLIFPAAFPNSPSSMFGHTLLRIDSSKRRHGTELLSYAVNFAAAAPDGQRGLGFVWKGLTGGYPGIFGLFPYYKKVKQYAWIENRDVWSYSLQLSSAELDRMVDHVWAMDHVEFAYYFLNKNCSYQLLSLIDVARPGLHLTRQYSWYAIPSDTIRSLSDVPGLLGPARFRPSMEAVLRSETHQLSAAEQSLARRVSRHRLSPDAPAVKALPRARQAAVLEVAYDALHYQLASDNVAAPVKGETGEVYANRILAARARLGGRSPFAPVTEPARSPDEGHRSLRFKAATVYAGDKTSLAFRLRPAYHDLLDDPGGYTHGQAIDFADVGLAVDPENGHVALDDFKLLSITSLSRRDAWFKPVSFTLSTGARRRPSTHLFTGRDNDLGYYLQGGPGLAWGRGNLTGYVFGQVSFDANPGLAPAYAFGAGPSAGLLYYPHPGVQMRADAGWLQYAAGADGHYGWAGLGVQVPLIRELALRSNIKYENLRRTDGLRIDLGVQAYF